MAGEGRPGSPDDVDLAGLIDLHIHSGPDVVERAGDDLDIAREAVAARMRAILLKSHHTLTAERAYLCERVLGHERTRIFGGLVLNTFVGGLNPRAVETALQLGARAIWMPTLSARGRLGNASRGGLSIFDEDGRILRDAYEIIDLVARADVLLCTGHLSPTESLSLIRSARERRVEKILVTHPDLDLIGMTLEQQIEAVSLGALVERTFVSTTATGGTIRLETIAGRVRAVGLEANVLTTDLGQPENPRPVDGMRRLLRGLRALGFADRDVRRIAGENPAQLLGLAT